MAMGAACNSSGPTPPGSSVGSSAEALRQLGRLGTEDVEKCRAFAARCAARADSGANPRCDRISDHCDDLETQLAEDRAELEQCLEEAATCEASAALDCERARAACSPKDEDFRARRGRTLECSSRVERCIDRGGAPGDAGADVCEDDADDFARCCHGEHDFGADAGAGRFGRRRHAGSGFDDDRVDDAGPSERSGFGPSRRR
jgi:hypothetical protein